MAAVKIGPLWGKPHSAMPAEINREWYAGRNRIEQQMTTRWMRSPKP